MPTDEQDGLATDLEAAMAADQAGLSGLMVAWAGIVGVNVAHALSRRSRR